MSEQSEDVLTYFIVEFSDAIAPLTYVDNFNSLQYLLTQLGYDVSRNIKKINIDSSYFKTLPSVGDENKILQAMKYIKNIKQVKDIIIRIESSFPSVQF